MLTLPWVCVCVYMHTLILYMHVQVYCTMEPSLYGLLLEDVMGNKRDTSAGTTVFTEVLIFKGSLLQALITHNELMEPFTNPPHNYKTLANPAVTLYCERNQVNLLTFVQKDLLCGIQILPDRLEAIYKLNWVEKIEIGSSVYVFLPLASSPQKATVQYIGEVNGEIGRRFGLKLMVCYIYEYSLMHMCVWCM